MLKPFPKRKQEKRFMTVCVSAFAADMNAIVCVADKALSYGDVIQWDADSTKIIKINPSGTLLLFSGDEEPNSKVLTTLYLNRNDLWYKDRYEIVETCQRQYKTALNDLVEAKLLLPRFLDKSTYLTAITAPVVNDLVRSLADEIKNFEMTSDLLVCGFDMLELPFMLDLYSPGVATDMSFTGIHAIGSGWEKAVSRLLFSEHKRAHSISRTLYDVFDAKANAEMAVGVGYEWDAVVILKNGFHDVPEDIKRLIEKAWGKYNRSPFEKFDPTKHDSPPPRDWKEQLEEWCNSLATQSGSQTSTDQR